ncbi:PAS domain S-box protein [Leptospira broomii serovar Hurstbridge str. 5399]|uniref:histidine kinase n=1 Tax=Leptospira broomii serovar Hurstbridge str. 5399 TaxID=1049789 RepID=T0EZ65_9LEPT|nr:response regulator [Leptospira broomii]EQA44155.1 PAS domain S-box protein [Leptospira broomii serovar Hurstbridge str. 5399]
MSSTSSEQPNILIVEDEWLLSFNLQKTLQNLGYRIAGVAANGQDAQTIFQETDPDLVLMDISIEGDMDGIQTAQSIQRIKDVPIVFMTAYTDDSTFMRAMDSASTYAYITKPFQNHQLKSSIEIALRQQKRFGQVKESGNEYRNVIQSISEGAVSLDGEGKVIFLNHAGEELTGWRLADAMGQPGDRVLSFIQTQFGDLEEDNTDLGNNLRYIPAVLARRDGKKIRVGFRVSPIRDEDGRIIGSIVTFSELSLLTISEQRISEMEKVIQSEMRLDSIQKLAAGIAHEINNPLMGIINYGNIIRNHRSAEPDVRNYARVIIEQGERISGIVRNLILFSKSDNEEATWVRFEEIVSAVEGMISALLRSKNLELIKDIPQELPELFLKQSQIKEVLYYLLYYYAAAMASQGGGIRLTAKFIKGSDAGKPEETNLEIRVSGSLSLEIDPDNAFQPFERIQSDDTRVGMGLSVCYGIIQSNRGKLLVRKSSSGTDFFVKLPVKFR